MALNIVETNTDPRFKEWYTAGTSAFDYDEVLHANVKDETRGSTDEQIFKSDITKELFSMLFEIESSDEQEPVNQKSFFSAFYFILEFDFHFYGKPEIHIEPDGSIGLEWENPAEEKSFIISFSDDTKLHFAAIDSDIGEQFGSELYQPGSIPDFICYHLNRLNLKATS